MTTLIETVRVIDGRAPLWPLHMRRLMQAGLDLGIRVPDLPEPAGGDDRVVRFEVGDGGMRVSEREVPPSAPIALATSPAVHRGYPHKITDRSWLEAARLSVQPLGADDALLLTGATEMVEATVWAIAWWDAETLCFPPLTLGGLPSVARARLTETVRGGVREVAIRREELAWRALVACNAARGMTTVHSLDGEPVPGNLRTTAVAGRFWKRGTG
jgi:branched-subunit amino acid aminotransferase/4-amino-4-deoxychorismate lyase